MCMSPGGPQASAGPALAGCESLQYWFWCYSEHGMLRRWPAWQPLNARCQWHTTSLRHCYQAGFGVALVSGGPLARLKGMGSQCLGQAH